MVGFDRTVFADIGARIKDAYVGSLNLIGDPGTLDGMTNALNSYKYQLSNSAEAKRVLQANPEALQYTPSGQAAGGGAPPPKGARVSGGILVERLSDGVQGTLDSEAEFNPKIYKRIDKATVAPSVSRGDY